MTRTDAEVPGKEQQRDAAVRQLTRTRTAMRVAAEPDAERGARQPVRTAGESPRGSVDGPRSPEDEQQTDYAGLFFLLRLASHLGMATFLADHRELVALDFPSCLLRHVAQRLALPPDDPALAVLPPADDAASRWDAEFVVPEAWPRSGVAAGSRLVRRAVGVGGDDRLALTDASWTLVLALWRDKATDPVHALSAGVPLTRGRSLRESLAMDLLLGSWLTAMRRWSHRYAGMGLRTLVRRPGRVAATRTHLDVFFTLRQIDIGVRRAGLDVDPGWLPWFGRVVTYHYDREGRGHAR